VAESLQSKLSEFLGAFPAYLYEDGTLHQGKLAPGSVLTIAQRVMAITRQHDEERGAQFTREQLAAAVDQVRDSQFGDDGPPPFGYAVDASVIADRLVEALARNADMLRPGRAFHLKAGSDPELGRMAALCEPHPTGPRTQDADLCARCGNQFKPGQVCDSCREVAAGVHLCDDQCPADPELHAMAVLLPALPMVSKLGHDARERVMDWARHRACDGRAPF
jgi:hypothetical protein